MKKNVSLKSPALGKSSSQGSIQRIRKLVPQAIAAVAVLMSSSVGVYASDHDDGETTFKARNLSLTDLYAFVESWQDSAGSADNLILVMNTNPRSLAQQAYTFNTRALYEFHLSRVLDTQKSARPKGADDIQVGFSFGRADATTKRQPISMTLTVKGRKVFSGSVGSTTSLADSVAGAPVVNSKTVKGSTVRVFAGLREDPFFFDVERFFRVRSFLATGNNSLGSGPTQGGANVFRSDATAQDFTVGYNVNAIVVSVPLSLIRASAQQNVFDVWETIKVPKELGSGLNFELSKRNGPAVVQTERLGRPGIGEALVLSDKRLAMFNSISPAKDLSPAAAPVRDEAVAVLTKLNQYGTSNGLAAPSVTDVATGFLPDVMRIDTSKSVAIGTAAYNSDFVIVDGSTAGAMLTGGRKLEDDVIDVTLSYLLNGDATGASVKDGVTYAGGTTCETAGQGTNPGNPGHRCLNGQTTRLGSATFPFLAAPQ
jgi:hypothetical protein